MAVNSLFSHNFHDSIELFRDEYSSILSKLNYGDILVVNLPNRFGKTVTTLKYFNQRKCKILYLSDRHDQISEIENGKKIRHWYGLSKICEKREDPFIKSLINRGLMANIICKFCNCDKSSCIYKEQFELPNDVIVVAPKQFIPTNYVMDKYWDAIIIDENIENSHKIEYTYPLISKGIFNQYSVNYELYKEIGSVISSPQSANIVQLKEKASNSIEELSRLIRKLKKKSNILKATSEESNLIQYLNNINNSIEWVSYARKYGPKEHFYKPYLHYAFDLRKEDNSKIIILNTSVNEWIYNKLAEQYEHQLPQSKFYSKELENKNSLLLKYTYQKRSCSKSKITAEEGTLFGGNYGDEILDMLIKAVSFANNKKLKLGIITFKSLKYEIDRVFGDKIHILSHFGGHQGSNKFDDVDMLIVIGTYHINPKALYLKYYQITGEHLKDNPAKWNNSKIINGTLISLTDNEELNKLKLYKLNEEQGQAIFRSGAHVKKGKIVIIFGHVPKGIEKSLQYRNFKSKNQLLGFLSKYQSIIQT
ncbi:MAG: hypothetical protein ACPK7O_01195 [Methanobacterium sp.]